MGDFELFFFSFWRFRVEEEMVVIISSGRSVDNGHFIRAFLKRKRRS